ncbi:MAG: IgGFc-binding protein [Polyangiaceae bacterium]|nr:IgGFc-binding protein [Polyangiaceae bacterium]
MNRSSWVTSIPLGLSALILGMAYVGCDDSYRTDTTTSSSGNGASGNSSGMGGSGGEVVFDPDGSVCEHVCSNDLRSVVDSCNDMVITACTADQGCLNGACIDNPCKAAEEAKSSAGCDYWALKTALRSTTSGACFAAFVANTWEKSVHINVAYDGSALDPAAFAYIPTIGAGGVVNYAPYDPVAGLPPGAVAILFLSRYSMGGSVIDCPKPAALGLETGFSGTGIGKAFHITTDYPVTAYQMVPFNGGTAAVTSATLLLPTSAWGTNYIAVNAYKAVPDPPLPQDPFGGYPSLAVLAKENNTKVTLLPKAAIKGGPGVAAAGRHARHVLLERRPIPPDHAN